jgi:carbonic anhydrase/acetyltransferase-like protein (isoleucine patch superfamily)
MNAPLLLPFAGISPKIDPSAFVAPGVVLVGDVRVGAESSLWFGTIVRGDEHKVIIGARTNIQDLCVCHETRSIGPLIVGSEVTVGHGAILHGCTIGDRCMIGMGATILDGAVIGEDCLVAAGAVVREGTKAPPRSLVAGNPAAVKRTLHSHDLERIAHAAEHYVKRAAEYRKLLAEAALAAEPPTD